MCQPPMNGKVRIDPLLNREARYRARGSVAQASRLIFYEADQGKNTRIEHRVEVGTATLGGRLKTP